MIYIVLYYRLLVLFRLSLLVLNPTTRVWDININTPPTNPHQYGIMKLQYCKMDRLMLNF